MTAQRRVVVTGLGTTSPVGGTAEETWDAILAGRSGARTMPFDWVQEYDLPVHFAAMIHTDPGEVLAKVEVRRNDPSAQYALVASREAWADAGAPDVDPLRLAACIGTGIGGVWTLLNSWDTLREKGPAGSSRSPCPCSCPTPPPPPSRSTSAPGPAPTRPSRRARPGSRRWRMPPR
jgi:3-oxoacyl-[acyl-carrier-protein] synthase II